MSDSKILITTAGLEEVVNAEKSGTAPVVLSHIAFGTGKYTPSADRTNLQAEFKRFDAIAGGSIGDNIIHIDLHDNSTEEYTVYEVGVFTESGTLFAVYSQSTPILQKAATSEVVLAVDITLTDIDAESITVGDTNFNLNPATTETAGIVELATESEAKAGADTTKAITPKTLSAMINNNNNIVHRTGNETVSGKKLFTSAHYKISSQIERETTPSANIWDAAFVVYDKNSNTFFNLQAVQDTTGQNQIRALVFDKSGSENQILSFGINSDGVPYATAPTPSAGDISTKIATTAFVNTKVKDYLPLSGGQMTATKAMTRDVNNSFLGLQGGTGENNDGAQLYLCGANHPSKPSGFQLHARNADTDKILEGKIDGTLLWNDKYVLNNSFLMPTDSGAVMLTAGTSSAGGAYFRLYGKDHTSGAGQFVLATTDGESTNALVGKPDGTLTWCGRPLTSSDNSDIIMPGTILPFAGTTVPAGYLACDGAAISRSTYKDLFNIIGTTWGTGDGSTTFNLPSLVDRYPIGAGTNVTGFLTGQSLPNITGKMVPQYNIISSYSGAFYSTSQSVESNRGWESSKSSTAINFNASHSNGIYGAAIGNFGTGKVIPHSATVNYIIKY